MYFTMSKFEKHRYSMRLPKDKDDDKYFRYFSDIYLDAMKNMESENYRRAFKLLKQGSRQYRILFTKGIPLSEWIIDECSLWLCQYYVRHKHLRKYYKILESNFVEYNNNYYCLTTGELIWRMVPIKELSVEYDFGLDLVEDSETNKAVIKLIRTKRGYRNKL